MQYKRFIVFTWSEYDNVAPLECIEDSFDDSMNGFDAANRLFESLKSDGSLACIFDCKAMRVCVI